MNPFDTLTHSLPQLSAQLEHLPPVATSEALWPMLQRLLTAHAPSSGANLPGGIGDVIAALAQELGLGEHYIPRLGSSGNAAISLGADKPQPDIVVVAHMDRPSFRVRSTANGALFPICANRFPAGEYRVPAKAVRFEQGRLIVGAQGVLIANTGAAGAATIRFDAQKGALLWQDTVLMDVDPTLEGGAVTGTGLDNCAGTLTALLSAAVLGRLDAVLRARNRRCLFVFTDQEEGPPESFFGHGAARLTYAVLPPALGCVVVDAQNAELDLVPQLGAGVSVSAASNWGRGSVVPPNFHALMLDLARGINSARPQTVQVNTGYLSRSDDMILGRWTPVLALSGPPLVNAHTGQESVRLSDIQSGVWWLSHFLAAALALAPELAPLYALGD